MNDYSVECRCTRCNHVFWIDVLNGYTFTPWLCPITCSGYGIPTGRVIH